MSGCHRTASIHPGLFTLKCPYSCMTCRGNVSDAPRTSCQQLGNPSRILRTLDIRWCISHSSLWYRGSLYRIPLPRSTIAKQRHDNSNRNGVAYKRSVWDLSAPSRPLNVLRRTRRRQQQQLRNLPRDNWVDGVRQSSPLSPPRRSIAGRRTWIKDTTVATAREWIWDIGNVRVMKDVAGGGREVIFLDSCTRIVPYINRWHPFHDALANMAHASLDC